MQRLISSRIVGPSLLLACIVVAVALKHSERAWSIFGLAVGVLMCIGALVGLIKPHPPSLRERLRMFFLALFSAAFALYSALSLETTTPPEYFPIILLVGVACLLPAGLLSRRETE